MLFSGFTAESIDPPCDDLKVEVEVTHTTDGLNNGSVEVEVIGGTAPYTYIFLDDNRNPITEVTSSNKVEGLSKGEMKYIVRDKKDCFVSDDLIIN